MLSIWTSLYICPLVKNDLFTKQQNVIYTQIKIFLDYEKSVSLKWKWSTCRRVENIEEKRENAG